MSDPARQPQIPGSATPALEGAPSSQIHEKRHESVILESPQPREEGSPSRP